MILRTDRTQKDLHLSRRDLGVDAHSDAVMLLWLRTGEVALACGEQVMRYHDLAETPLLKGGRAKERENSCEVLR